LSNRKAEKGYGRWLTFLSVREANCLEQTSADRITPDRVKAYVDDLLTLKNSTATVLARLQELGEMARVMDPSRNWRFINAIASKIRARHKPARDKSNLRLSDEIFELGLDLIGKASKSQELIAAILHRDGLMIVFLALVPLRRRNMSSIGLDRNLIATAETWLICFGSSETKTHAPLEIDWPGDLVPALKAYLDIHRPLLASQSGRWTKPTDKALWVSSDGSPMTEIAIYDRIRKHTGEAFGAAINPHLFRDAAATTLAIADPEHVRVAAPLLGHRTFRTTERHYQQAKTLEAHRSFVEAIFGPEKKGGISVP
jgi:integrase/recombinase XerD